MGPISELLQSSQVFFDELKQNPINKIGEIALKALFCIASVAFVYTTSAFFWSGFIIGFIWDEPVQTKIQEISEKIKGIWETQPWFVVIAGGVAGGFGAFLCLPEAWCTASFFCGAYLGSSLGNISKTKEEPNSPV